MYRPGFVFSVCLLVAVNCFAQEEASGKEQEETIQGEGWVIEVDSGSVTYGEGGEVNNPKPEEQENTAGHRGKTSNIEFIVGGQGKDGVAKRTKLPMSD